MLDDTVRVAPVRAADLPEVGAFLHDHLNPRLSAADWAAAAVPTWQVDAPNHGFLLRAGDRLVGVQLAFYAEREVEGRTVRFCNLGAWCVLEPYRGHGLRLLRAALAQRGHVFTDLSPSGSVVAINERLRFRSLDTTTALVPNLPRLPGRRRARVVTDLDEIDRALDGAERALFRDHRRAGAAHHVLLDAGPRGRCYVMYRSDRRRGMRLFATLLHVSDPDVLRRCRPDLARHLLARRLPVTLAELRVVGGRPAGSVLLRHPRPKQVRGTEVSPDAVDNLYSELVLVAW
ncbi:MAG TPA: hypothetical protein VMF51_14850 [Nocardioides sp.]|uniref:hypothetical protein n=1 Tax=Nocardioides sp. TaxID=35761 RepID=UPI002C5A5E03|nr:hypothetical protein [Nocardioides sp.]HTW16412.1 hypothetical protein [Nocardioides sp.]